MPFFAYKGKNREGKIEKGVVEAAEYKEALRILRQREVVLTRLWEKSIETDFRTARDLITLNSSPSSGEVGAMTLQWATMLNAGIPLLQCLEILSTHSESRILNEILSAIYRDVEGGITLSDALSKHPKVFSRFYINMIQVGESTGQLDTMLFRLAEQIERLTSVKGRIISALAYPLTLFLIAGMVLGFMLGWIVPLFGRMFADVDQALPWLTQVVLHFGFFIKTHVLAIMLGMISVGIVTRRLYKMERCRTLLDRWILLVPFLGKIIKNAAIVQVTRTLSILLGSGVSILDSMAIASKISGNSEVEQAIEGVHLHVREGSTISKPLAQSKIFPPLVTQMIAIGETTGSLDVMLGKVADLYEQDLNRAVSLMTSLFEPVVIVLVGLGIGLMVIAMYLPIFSMGSILA